MDPSNQIGGIAKYIATLLAGILVSKGKLDPGDASTIVGSVLAIASVVWQILHRKKVAAAQAALAAHQSTTDPSTISNVAKAA